MGVSGNRGYPQIIHFNRIFHYKPSILGYHYFWKHPYGWMIIHNSPHYGKASTNSSKQHAKGYNPAPVDRYSGKTIKIQLCTVPFIHLRWCRIGIIQFQVSCFACSNVILIPLCSSFPCKSFRFPWVPSGPGIPTIHQYLDPNCYTSKT